MSDQSPTDEFKRALGAATKAISGERELEVSFGGDIAGIVRDQIMLSSMPKTPDDAHVAKARGEADALALRIALHDPEVHFKNQPANPQARQIYEALEQARVEALGSAHLSGLGDNLMAAVDARARRKGFHKDNLTHESAPLAEAMGYYAREIFMERDLPEGVAGVMDVRRKEIEKSHGKFDFLKDLLTD